ncbi:MAG: hypothetical protein OXC79_06015 [Candidatus Poribacteria bacterium]|nr:hypothetical protein [Candidatus Poribacteria bacterium]
MNRTTTNRSTCYHTSQNYPIKFLIFIWREEVFVCKDTSLLQRSNISIEKPASILALQRSAM